MAITQTTDAEKAGLIEAAARELRLSLGLYGGGYTPRARHDLLKLCNAIIDLIDDGDCLAERERMMDELRCDEGGNPLPPEPSDLARLPTGYALRVALNGSVGA